MSSQLANPSALPTMLATFDQPPVPLLHIRPHSNQKSRLASTWSDMMSCIPEKRKSLRSVTNPSSRLVFPADVVLRF
ncbi:hypothetical protein E2P81_ATG01755 [Venturia nashicola]|uniref:Uncharacterized protein n=1 Tax=Venturia nashicola TaxID=86259 RepID=A0A4Z1NT81_9PEZI|nr:hypothetical protein E6O75_ATG01803 [Venturia nashicola]TLD19027.1 hypothetical protein E2P81_ATG01755 [Venturia nashicola]